MDIITIIASELFTLYTNQGTLIILGIVYYCIIKLMARERHDVIQWKGDDNDSVVISVRHSFLIKFLMNYVVN